MPPAHPLDRADAVAAPRQVGLLPTLCLDGAWQMAIDEQLLEMVLADPKARPVLRLYRWSRPTLSVGHHQHHLPQHWLTLASAGAVDLVRRPSGGRAVLHGGDLSYALIWPAAPSQRRKAYGKACGWLCHAFAQFGMPLRFGRRAPSREQPNCFAVSTSADLVHRDGSKRIGSAQLWRRGALLQHGSIMLAPPVDLWRQLFDEPPPCLPKLPFGAEALEQRLILSAARALPHHRGGVELVRTHLAPADRQEIRSRLRDYSCLEQLIATPADRTSDIQRACET